MKKVVLVSAIAALIGLGLAASTFAANFSILLGTWEVTEKNFPSLVNLESIETHVNRSSEMKKINGIISIG